ncbi:MAG: TonB C-terminal domain-containing protein [Nitrospira sp.]|nr:TonB C-terminal domain-containing protein [Nitrospira sp.]
MTGARWPQWAVGVACLWASLGLSGLVAAAPPAARHESGDRSVVFELAEQPASGTLQTGPQVALTLRLHGEPAGPQEMVAIVEGTLLTRVMVSMVPGEGSRSWQAEVSLDLPTAGTGMEERPLPNGQAGRRDLRQRFHRVDVSFARLRGMGLTSFLRRSIYINLEPHPERKVEAKPEPAMPEAVPDIPQPVAPAVMTESAPLPGIERESVPPVLDGIITESDLPLPKPVPVAPVAMDYWQAVEQRVTTQFRQRVKAGTTSVRLPRVQFRLYWDGVARMIALERSSGSPQVDLAGMDSVVDAHPFPPFPDNISDLYVDVHVEFAAPKPAVPPRRGKKR